MVSPALLLMRFDAYDEGSLTVGDEGSPTVGRDVASFVPFAERHTRLTTRTMTVAREVVAKYLSNHTCGAENIVSWIRLYVEVGFIGVYTFSAETTT